MEIFSLVNLLPLAWNSKNCNINRGYVKLLACLIEIKMVKLVKS